MCISRVLFNNRWRRVKKYFRGRLLSVIIFPIIKLVVSGTFFATKEAKISLFLCNRPGRRELKIGFIYDVFVSIVFSDSLNRKILILYSITDCGGFSFFVPFLRNFRDHS